MTLIEFAKMIARLSLGHSSLSDVVMSPGEIGDLAVRILAGCLPKGSSYLAELTLKGYTGVNGRCTLVELVNVLSEIVEIS